MEQESDVIGTKNLIGNQSKNLGLDGQSLDQPSEKFTEYVKEIAASFSQQQNQFNSTPNPHLSLDLKCLAPDSHSNTALISLDINTSMALDQHFDRDSCLVGSTIQDGLPAIMIDTLGQTNAEEDDLVDGVIKSFDAERGLRSDWQRPRSKSLEPGAIEDFFPIKMESSDIYNVSGNSSKGFLGFSLNSKFLGYGNPSLKPTTSGNPSPTSTLTPNSSELLTVSSKALGNSQIMMIY